MIECQKLGLTKSIGVSNFCRRQLQTLLDSSSVRPANLQIESHPFFSNSRLVDFCQQHNIQVTAFSPLASPPHRRRASATVGTHPVLLQVARKYDKTPAQVALRLQLERGVAVIPKSNNTQRQQENISIFDFRLTQDDVTIILQQCDTGRRLLDQRQFSQSPEYPFNDDF